MLLVSFNSVRSHRNKKQVPISLVTLPLQMTETPLAESEMPNGNLFGKMAFLLLQISP